MNALYNPANRESLYDYLKMLSEKVVDFYANFDRVLNEQNLFSRGQCSGAPCDIISAYARLDIPEGEAMLYEPEYNSIPASAALLAGKKVVSAETFTCIYGWPDRHIRKEQTADLKMVADALFANGVNHIVWHGKAHNPKDQDSVNFYATVHVGKEGTLAPEIPAFNDYLAAISETMKRGNSYSDVAVYLPTEDAWVNGTMPKEKQFTPQSPPLLKGDALPPYWAREKNHSLYIFFANPKSGRLTFPVGYGQSFSDKLKTVDVVLDYDGKEYELNLRFEPYQSLLYKIENGTIEEIDISFLPEVPVVREIPADNDAPWLVK